MFSVCYSILEPHFRDYLADTSDFIFVMMEGFP